PSALRESGPSAATRSVSRASSMLTSPGSSSAPRAYSSSLVSASRSSSGSSAGICGCVMAPPRGSAEGVDDRGVEGVEIVGGAGGDEAEAGRVVDHDLLVDPAPARVDQVGADGGDGGEFAAVRQARLDQQPGRMADRGH